MTTTRLWAGDHVGRDFTGTRLETDCPCPKAACGLVLADRIRPDCPSHAARPIDAAIPPHPQLPRRLRVGDRWCRNPRRNQSPGRAYRPGPGPEFSIPSCPGGTQ